MSRLSQPYLRELADLRDGSRYATAFSELLSKVGWRPKDVKQVVMAPRTLASADKSIKTNKGEIPASLTSENVIKVLLSANVNTGNSPAPAKEEKLAITPNYIKNPVLAYKVDTSSPKEKEASVIQEKRPRLEAARPSPPAPRSGDFVI